MIIRIIDLFAGVGGIRLGFQQAAEELNQTVQCVFSSEIDKWACMTYEKNYGENPMCDITKIDEKAIPDFDVCLAGFPCQAFSMAGKRAGFEDTRGTLFFDVARIIKEKKPYAFLLENVKGLVHHRSGKTLETILNVLKNDLGYTTYFQVLNAKDFGLAQNRERIYIVGFRNGGSAFKYPEPTWEHKSIRDILEENPVPANYYLSDVYIKSMIAHKERHLAKGHGFGYEIRDLDGTAGTIVCGGMGKERNLIIDPRQKDLSDKGQKHGNINQDGLRVMTPLEWERLQGFPDNWTAPLTKGHRYKQMGNSVAVPVIKHVSKRLIEEMLSPSATPQQMPKQLSLRFFEELNNASGL